MAWSDPFDGWSDPFDVVLPGKVVKNREDRLVVLNRTARSVVDEVRGIHPEYVFTYKGHPINGINNSS